MRRALAGLEGFGPPVYERPMSKQWSIYPDGENSA